MIKRNKDIKRMIKEAGVYQWQIAEAIGIDETTLCRWLRFQLTDEKRELIINAIRQQTGE